jgi:UDP-glucose:(glucosyl)LPS alpha-1,2-glucosyltransferase
MPVQFNEISEKAMSGTEIMGLGLARRLPGKLLDPFQIILSRYRGLVEGKIPLYWMHDLPFDQESLHLQAGGHKKFKKIVYVSNWLQEWVRVCDNVPYSAGVVIRNAIDPLPEHEKPSGPLRLIYHTTPHRGLALLVPVFEKTGKGVCD